MEKVDPKYKYYLRDLGTIILERARQAIEEREKEKKESDSYYYQSGRVMAFGEVIAIMQQQAEGFQIDLKEINLKGIDTDKEFV